MPLHPTPTHHHVTDLDALTLGWRRTGLGGRDDYMAEALDRADRRYHFARLIHQRHVAEGQPAWTWSVLIHAPRMGLAWPLSGAGRTKDEGAEAVRACWARLQAWQRETGQRVVMTVGRESG